LPPGTTDLKPQEWPHNREREGRLISSRTSLLPKTQLLRFNSDYDIGSIIIQEFLCLKVSDNLDIYTISDQN
jgi:hypothetical protein